MDIKKRLLLKALASCGLLTAVPSTLWAMNQSLVFPFGKLPAANKIQRVLSAGAPADILLLALVPEKLLGFSAFEIPRNNPWFSQSIQTLPKLGRLSGRASTLSIEQLLALKPDIIIDSGSVTDTFRSQAERITALTGIPYLLVSGKLSDSAEQIRQVADVLGVVARAEPLANMAEKILTDARTFSLTQRKPLQFYAARGAKGLETGLAGSLHTEAAELLGLENVAKQAGRHGLGQVSMEQLLLWQPDVVLTQDESTYQHILTNSQWQGINAVQQQQVLHYPRFPFGWLDAPPGINRLLGLRRLHAHFDPKIQAGLQADTQAFFELFFHSTLSDESYQQLVKQP